MESNVYTYKAWLVAKGFTQKHDIVYDETFSLVIMLKFIKIMLVIIAYHKYKV